MPKLGGEKPGALAPWYLKMLKSLSTESNNNFLGNLSNDDCDARGGKKLENFSLTILVPVWFIVIRWRFFILGN